MKATKKLFKDKISVLLNNHGNDGVLSEATLPAYVHKNPVINYIFWKRIAIASTFISERGNTKRDILDFGCGTGVFSYEMAQKGHNLYALDMDLTPVRLLGSMIKYPENITFKQGNFLEIDFQGRTFDFIVALDVLEHIPLTILPSFLEKFNLLLKEGGYVIVSGPTENILYKIGRKLAGADFTGEYHETTIGRIKDVFKGFFDIKIIRKLVWPCTLFEIFQAKKRKV